MSGQGQYLSSEQEQHAQEDTKSSTTAEIAKKAQEEVELL